MRRGLRKEAFSLIEMIVVVAFLAIVAAIAVPVMSNVMQSSSYQTAQRNLNLLNGAVISFNEGNWELVLTTNSGSSDELAIFDSLRYRAATNPAPGSPYLPQNATFVATSDPTTYRAIWNGRMFDFSPVGSNGTGIDLVKIMGPIQAPPTATPVQRSTN
ncbi:MAG: type II secretion system protein [Verrucomicrobiae bacterium]